MQKAIIQMALLETTSLSTRPALEHPSARETLCQGSFKANVFFSLINKFNINSSTVFSFSILI